jgi:molecular chaperone GrpE
MAKRKAEKTITGEMESVETKDNEQNVEETGAQPEDSSTPQPEDSSTAQQEEMVEASSEADLGETDIIEETPEVEEAELQSEAISNLKEELELARQEAAQNLENWQRAAAELANYKRRQEEQLKLQRDRIKAEVLQGVISALDDMDLAFQNLPGELNGQLVGWVEGFRLVQRKLDRILDEQNVMPISSQGQFDPNFHEAVSYEESDEHEPDTIIAEVRKGYQIGNRVIRPALVRVAR